MIAGSAADPRVEPSRIIDARVIGGAVIDAPIATTRAALVEQCAKGKGPPAACAALVDRYDRGKSLEFDEQSLYDRACSGGSVIGCRKLGLMLMNQLEDEFTVPGRALLEKACRTDGDALACLHLGDEALTAPDVSTRSERAVSNYFERGCELGSAEVCARLAYLYETLRDVKDLDKAAAAYRRACALGDQPSCTKPP